MNSNTTGGKTFSFTLCLSTVLLGLSMSLAAQDAPSTLSLMNTGELVINGEENLINADEYIHVAKIYQDLVNARGDFRFPIPTLTLTDVEGRVATIDYQKNIINLEKKAFDLINPLGPSAIAFLLGHELTHYYERHAWRSSFANSASTMDCGSSIQKLQLGVIQESEADYLGGFLAYSAGYGVFDKGDQIISALYEGYDMPDESAVYPTKDARIELTQKSAKKLKALVHVFDMANYLFVTDQRKKSYRYYDYILRSYQSRELYNNLAVGHILDAMAHMDSTEIKYSYPLVMDVVLNGSRSIADKPAEIKKALDQADSYCNAAINLDPNYVPAYLNKVIAYTLAGDIEKASLYLMHEAKPRAAAQAPKYSKSMIDIEIIEAILADKNNEKTEAQKTLEKLSENGNAIAAKNLRIVNGEAVVFSENNQLSADLTADTIGAFSIRDYASNPKGDNGSVIKFSSNNTFFRHIPADKESVCFAHMEEKDNDRILFVFQKTAENFPGTTSSGIQIGTSESVVLKKHGTPKSTLETVEGRMLVYDTVIFVIGAKGTVTRWINYDKSIL